MIQETKILQEGIERHKFCDVCNMEIRIGLACSKAKCGYCGKDLCENCIEHEETSWSDYRGQIWCKNCWELGNEYRPKIELLEQEIEKLYTEWQVNCKTPVFSVRPVDENNVNQKSKTQ